MHVQVSFLKWELGETMLAVSWQLMIPILSCTRKTGIVDDPSLEKKKCTDSSEEEYLDGMMMMIGAVGK